MHLAVTARVLGFLLMIFSLTMLTPIIVAWIYGEQTSQTFLSAFAITLLVGLLFWFPAKNKKGELRTRDGFIVTVFFWLVLSTFGALPLMLSEAPNLSFMDALFESISGLTTTGASPFRRPLSTPPSLLATGMALTTLRGVRTCTTPRLKSVTKLSATRLAMSGTRRYPVPHFLPK